MIRRLPPVLATIGLLTFGACSSSDDTAPTTNTATTTEASTTTTVDPAPPTTGVDTCKLLTLEAVSAATGIAWEPGEFDGLACVWQVTGTSQRLVVAEIDGANLSGFFAIVYSNNGTDIAIDGTVHASVAVVPDASEGDTHVLLAIERTPDRGVSVSLTSPTATSDQALAIAGLVPAG